MKYCQIIKKALAKKIQNRFISQVRFAPIKLQQITHQEDELSQALVSYAQIHLQNWKSFEIQLKNNQEQLKFILSKPNGLQDLQKIQPNSSNDQSNVTVVYCMDDWNEWSIDDLSTVQSIEGSVCDSETDSVIL